MGILAAIVGNAGADAELRYIGANGDNAVLDVRVAVNRYDAKTKTKVTDWVSVTLFGKRAVSIAPFVTKGKTIFANGTLFNREYTKKDGTTGVSLELKANDIDLVGGKSDAPQKAPTTDYLPQATGVDEPF